MYSYEEYQFDWLSNNPFIIVTGPRLSGKSHFVKTYFKKLDEPYVVIDVARAAGRGDNAVDGLGVNTHSDNTRRRREPSEKDIIENLVANNRYENSNRREKESLGKVVIENIIVGNRSGSSNREKESLKKDIVENLVADFRRDPPGPSVVSYNVLPKGEVRDFDSIFRGLPEGTHVIIDHADLLAATVSDDFDPRETFQEFIDFDELKFVFLPRSTSKLLDFLGPLDYSSPLYRRFEKYVEFVRLSPDDSVRFLNECAGKSVKIDVSTIYSYTGGLRGAICLLVRSGLDGERYRSALRRIVLRDIGDERALKILRVLGCPPARFVWRIEDFERDADVLEKLVDFGYVEYVGRSRVAAVRPFCMV